MYSAPKVLHKYQSLELLLHGIQKNYLSAHALSLKSLSVLPVAKVSEIETNGKIDTQANKILFAPTIRVIKTRSRK